MTQLIRQSTAPMQLAVIQRAGRDIPESLWADCCRLAHLEILDKDKLDKDKKEDVENVLKELNKLGGSPHSEIKPMYDLLLAAWNQDQPDETKLGKPTDEFVASSSLSGLPPVHPRITLLGSDRYNPVSAAPRPGNLLLPAILKFISLFQATGQALMPNFMGVYLHGMQALYGQVENEIKSGEEEEEEDGKAMKTARKNLSPLNIQMLIECIQKGNAFLVLQPYLEGTYATSAEVGLLEAQGFRPDKGFLQRVVNEMNLAINIFRVFDAPQLYVPSQNPLNPQDMDVLVEVAKDYIDICQKWIVVRPVSPSMTVADSGKGRGKGKSTHRTGFGSGTPKPVDKSDLKARFGSATPKPAGASDSDSFAAPVPAAPVPAAPAPVPATPGSPKPYIPPYLRKK